MLRARSDLDRGATREAALQLRIALEAALAELADYADAADLGQRLDELRAARGEVGEAANTALAGPLDDGQDRGGGAGARPPRGRAARAVGGRLRVSHRV